MNLEMIYGYEEYVGMLIGAGIYIVGLFIYKKHVKQTEVIDNVR
jgi:hypothetical protein